MKRIVIWGCGKYGTYLCRAINMYFWEQYLVVAMGDQKFIELNSMMKSGKSVFSDTMMAEKYEKIIGFQHIKKMYDSGQIDGVIIGLLDKNEYKKAEDIISVLGIEIFDIGHSNRIFAEQVAERTYKLKNENISVYVVKDVCLFAHETWDNRFYRFAYLITNSNKILWETDRYLSLSSHPAEDIFIPEVKDSQNLIEIKKAVSLLQLGSDFNYGHFVFSCMGKICSLEETGYDGSYILYDSKFAKEWIKEISKIYKISDNRIIWINEKSDKLYHINEIHCIENIVDSSVFNARLLNSFADNILKSIIINNTNVKDSYKRIYLKRSHSRKLVGCEEIFDEYNIKEIVPENYPLEEQIRMISMADVVVAAHGAAVTNCLFMKRGSTLIVTFGSGFIDMFFLEMIRIRGINYRMLVSQKEYAEYDGQADYFIHPTLMKVTLDEICH